MGIGAPEGEPQRAQLARQQVFQGLHHKVIVLAAFAGLVEGTDLCQRRPTRTRCLDLLGGGVANHLLGLLDIRHDRIPIDLGEAFHGVDLHVTVQPSKTITNVMGNHDGRNAHGDAGCGAV
ncbi:hypothetical protein D3C77_633200 [compost metagenome]